MTTMVDPIGWTLIHFLWEGLLIGLVHEIAIRLAARRSPGQRYAISLLALAAVTLAPIVTLAALWPASGPTALPAAEIPPVLLATVAESAPMAWSNTGWLPWIVALWLIGVALMSVRFGVGLLALNRLATRADYHAVPLWMQQELSRLSAIMNIRAAVGIALSARVSSPLVIGWLKPIVLLPLSAATGLDHHQIRMVLAHELAHLRRYDHVVNLAQVIIETLLFYHPAVHRISKSLRQEREQCCDDMAAAIGGNRLEYARVLARLEEMRQYDRRHALALGIAEEELYTRIQRLVGVAPDIGQRGRWLPLVMVGIAMLAALRPLDFSAPLLPDVFRATAEQTRVALALPPATSPRAFTPIGAAHNEITPLVHDRPPGPATDASTTASAVTPPVVEAGRTTANVIPEAIAPTPTLERTPQREKEANSMTMPAAEQATTPVTSGGELLHAEEPVYPRRALRAGREGEVELEFTITVDGTVTDIEVRNATPRGIFESAARDAVTQWRYRPFMEDGKAVAKRATQLVEFRLASESLPRGGTTGADCKEQTGTRLCRAENADTVLRIGE